MHPTLTPRTNLRLISIFLAAGIAVAYFCARPLLWDEFLAGAGIGVIAGMCQLCAVREAEPALLAADDAFAVRRALKTSRWGRAYLVVFWAGSIAMIVVAVYLFRSNMIIGWIAGYVAMAFVRDVITLRGTLELARMETSAAPHPGTTA